MAFFDQTSQLEQLLQLLMQGQGQAGPAQGQRPNPRGQRPGHNPHAGQSKPVGGAVGGPQANTTTFANDPIQQAFASLFDPLAALRAQIQQSMNPANTTLPTGGGRNIPGRVAFGAGGGGFSPGNLAPFNQAFQQLRPFISRG